MEKFLLLVDLVAFAGVSAILFSMAVAGKRAARRASWPARCQIDGPGLVICTGAYGANDQLTDAALAAWFGARPMHREL